MTDVQHTPDAEPARVTLSVPAKSAFASVVRSTATGLAARLDFTIDEVEDLRIAVGEADALMLEVAAPRASLDTVFTLAPGFIQAQLTVATVPGAELDINSFAWQVLNTLADTCTHDTVDDTITLTLTVTSALSDLLER
ncbi:anti-sigma factor [Nocardioides yefusunii]|uniref:Anti-sigma factor n=1 Tax=Nocardioides yefusunii TaxID=2500546 RepID=A0ABW1QW85_9ACTN|nr:anti-sigma factor [Nocardioides yefusunii]